MPQDWKTSVNNLIVVWQGASWSVIAPDGHVLFRNWDKNTALNWARQNYDYASDEYEPYDWDENQFPYDETSEAVTLSELLSQPNKAKRRLSAVDTTVISTQLRVPEWLLGTLIILGTGGLCIGVIASINFAAIGHEIRDFIAQINVFGLAVLGLIGVAILSFIKEAEYYGRIAVMARIFVIIAIAAVINSFGIFSWIWHWVF